MISWMKNYHQGFNMLKSVNPFDGKIIEQYSEYSSKEITSIISQSDVAFQEWQDTNFSDRSKLFKNVSKILKYKNNHFAKLITLEMGKPIAESLAEVEKCASVCDYFAENAEIFLAPQSVKTDSTKSYISFQPLGVILAVMPWNFPFWQVFRFASPTLMAGNTGILKHASNVSGCSLAIEQIFLDAGFPESVFRSILISGNKISSIIENPSVRAITLTGSTSAGKAVASKAGEMIKKTVLELGGSDPYLILEDADIAQAAKLCAFSRLLNTGQSCIAAKRFIVVEDVIELFTTLLIKNMEKAKIGNPLDEDTLIGPMARIDLRDELHKQVLDSITLGAKLIFSGKMPNKIGTFYPPTVLTNVKPGMPAFDEELFGPVAAIISARDEAEAIALANKSVFGLGAAVFTKDITRGEDIAESHLDAGNCFVNDFVKSDPRLPFGGIKESGYGRELGKFGIYEFVNVKTISIK